jgi:hypothetical protein
VVSNVITLSPRLTTNQGDSPLWQVPCVIMTGAMGATNLNLKIPLANARKQWVVPEETGYYSYDFMNWSACDSVSQDATHTTCVLNGPMTGDTVYFARERMWGAQQVSSWITRIDGEYPGLFRPVPGETGTYEVATFSAQTNEIGGTVPATPLYAALLTNGSGLRKPRVCLMSGVHSGENYGTEVYLNALEYILSEYVAGTTFARNILNRWDILAIPYANAIGREGGHCRSQWTGGSANDMNRNFDDLGSTIENVTITRPFMARQLSVRSTDIFIDYHTQYFSPVGDDGIQGYYSGLGSELNTSWITKYQSRGSYTNYGSNPGGTVIGWCVDNRLARLGQVIEQNEQSPKTVADGQTIATYGPLVFNDMIVAGDFGSTQLATSRFFL